MSSPTDRKIIQIATATRRQWDGNGKPVRTQPTVVALCDDGAIFQHEIGSEDWERLPAIPQY